MRHLFPWLVCCAILTGCSGSESYHRGETGSGGRGTGGGTGGGAIGSGGTTSDGSVDQRTDGGTDSLAGTGGGQGGAGGAAGAGGGLGLGKTCAQDSDCAVYGSEATGHCSKDKVCCKTDCQGTCMTCKTVGSPGTCSAVPNNYDPNNDCPDDRLTDATSCGRTGVCDGAGACKKYDQNTSCVSWSCIAGIQTFARICDGQGTCIPANPPTGSCGGFACGKNASAPCVTSCTVATQATDCQAPALCQPKAGGGMTCGAKGTGVACTADAECTSLHCAQGVCCSTTCDGICKSCALGGGLNGVCTDVPPGQDPLNQCTDSRATDPLSCGTDGMCDGAGACRNYGTTTVCGNKSCIVSTLFDAPKCDGKGTCADGASSGSCAPYVCGTAISCKSTCTSNADCAAPYTCRGGACTLKPDGNSCTTDTECLHGNCVTEPGQSGGTCCNTACAGACKSCSTGTCVNAAAGAADPRALCADARQSDATSCGQTGVCDGVGACSLYAKGTTCAGPSCTGSTLTGARRCDGAGTCEPASLTADCAPYQCGAGSCLQSCTGDAECKAGSTCASGSCGKKPVGAAGCTQDSDCGSGHCARGMCCATACSGSCVSCSLPGSEGFCAAVPAGQDPNDDCSDNGNANCGTNGVCDGGGQCAMYADGTNCASPACNTGGDAVARGTCQAGSCKPVVIQACSPFMCNAAACRTTCTVDAECLAPYTCNAGTCSLKTVGKTCASDAQCAAPAGDVSGHCAQGVCCSSACAGCNTCAAPGQEGTCQKAAAGTDPNNFCAQDAASTCKQDGTCDGNGGCRKWDATTVCFPRACPAGGATGVQQVLCSGTGAGCGLAAALDCTPFMCNATQDGCRTTCDSDADCVPGAKCSGPGGNCGWLPDGQVCVNDAQCTPGHKCVGIPGGTSVCCNNACTGPCRSCGLTGSVGTCSMAQPGATVAADRDPKNDCADTRTEGATPNPFSCDTNGVCDGSGACQKYASGTSCSASSCSDTSHVTQSSCNGTGTCQAPAPVSCNAYACNAGACNTSCTVNADCAPGYLCMTGTCQLGVNLKVQSQFSNHGNWLQTDQLKILNLGTTAVDSTDLAMRLWFTNDNHAVATTDTYCWNTHTWTCAKKTFIAVSPARTNATMYMEATWPGTPNTTMLAAGASIVDSWSFHYSDWTNFDLSNDYSLMPASSMSTMGDNPAITLYWKGMLVWGVEPQ